MKGYMYILRCADDTFYTGSTNNLDLRIEQHNAGEGANYTRKRLPVELLYYEEYERIDYAFYREKQVQGWSRKKKEALMKGDYQNLHELAACKNDRHYIRLLRLTSTTICTSHSATDESGDFDCAQSPTAPVVERSRNHRTI